MPLNHLLTEDEKNLVHADFDLANIIVQEVYGIWKITGILDWEFSFSGSVLCDVANMLRYAHRMPSIFEEAFLQGLLSKSKKGQSIVSKFRDQYCVALPENWRITVHMLNLLSLLDCLVRSDPQNRPNQCSGIRELIDHILSELEKMV